MAETVQGLPTAQSILDDAKALKLRFTRTHYISRKEEVKKLGVCSVCGIGAILATRLGIEEARIKDEAYVEIETCAEITGTCEKVVDLFEAGFMGWTPDAEHLRDQDNQAAYDLGAELWNLACKEGLVDREEYDGIQSH